LQLFSNCRVLQQYCKGSVKRALMVGNTTRGVSRWQNGSARSARVRRMSGRMSERGL